MPIKPISPKRKIATLIITLLCLVILIIAVLIQQWLLVDLPHPNELYQHATAPSTKIFDRHGTLLYEITDPHQGLHTPLSLTDIPVACRQATIATEDASFYTNPGVDAWAIVRALYINIKGGEVLSGGSTITQQLARNLMLSPQERIEISLTRKLREAILAWRLARTYSKDQILTLYLNETYYGNLAYGIEAASRTYFGKHTAELDLAECALLAGLPQSPANYNPLEFLSAAKARQQIVLNLMTKHGLISADTAESAHREKLGLASTPFPIKAPHFVMYIRGELERRYGLEAIYKQGLHVYTTLDLDMQDTARQVAQRHLTELAKQHNGEPPKVVRNAAVAVLDPHSGELLAMLGSPNYFDTRIDGAVNATTASRQPGSSIKPFTYAAAFDPQIAAEYGYTPLTPASMMVDVRTAFVTKEGQPYVPENYDRTWRGPVLLRQSLASSYNLIAVKVLDYIGFTTLTDLARNLGITTFDNKEFGLALTLGGGEVRLLELTAAYGALANGGQKIEPVTITRITDTTGTLLYESPKNLNPGPQVLTPRTAYLITDILSDSYARRSTFGAGSPLQLSRPAAAKTGTTQDWRDNWTVGYTPDMVVGVWVGNADNEPMRHVSGVTGAAPIWHDVMEELLKAKPLQEFTKPKGLLKKTVCAENGLVPVPGSGFRVQSLTNDEEQITNDEGQMTKDESTQHPELSTQPSACSHTIDELFIAGTEPKRFDDWHMTIAIDRRTGLRASPECPLEAVTFKPYIRYPAAAQVWAKKQGVPQPPTLYSPLCLAATDEGRRTNDTGQTLNSTLSTQNPTNSTNPINSLIFTSPDQGTVFRIVPNIPADKQKIKVTVRPIDDTMVSHILLRVNGQSLAEGTETLWQMSPGEYTFDAVGIDQTGNRVSAQSVTVWVMK